MRTYPITARQKVVLNVIAKFISKEGYSPTVRDVASSLGVTVKAAYDHLVALRKKGYIEWSEEKSRTMKIIKGA